MSKFVKSLALLLLLSLIISIPTVGKATNLSNEASITSTPIDLATIQTTAPGYDDDETN